MLARFSAVLAVTALFTVVGCSGSDGSVDHSKDDNVTSKGKNDKKASTTPPPSNAKTTPAANPKEGKPCAGDKANECGEGLVCVTEGSATESDSSKGPQSAPVTETGTCMKDPCVTDPSSCSTDSSSDEGMPSGPGLCIPNASVFCRCDDNREGTKSCAADGSAFSACSCK